MHSSIRFTTICLIAFVALPLGLTGCGSSDGPAPPQASIAGGSTPETNAPVQAAEPLGPVELNAQSSQTASPAKQEPVDSPVVLIKTSMGEIRVKLDAERAPQTVENFLDNYVDRGFYAQTIFHYVEDEFMVAGGGFTPQYEPKETRTPVFNESTNGLSNRRGTIAMARHPEHVHSATSQFFFNLVDNKSLDHEANDDGLPNGYCVFGEVIEGLDVIDKIAKVNVSDREGFPNAPVDPIIVETIQRITK